MRKTRAISCQTHFVEDDKGFIGLQYKQSLKVAEHSEMLVYHESYEHEEIYRIELE